MASKRAKRRKSCEKKIRHETKEAANAQRFLATHYVAAYPCSFCGGWHVGHPPQKKRTRRAEFI